MALPEHDDGKGVVLVYATCPDREVAIRIAKACVSARLAACVNIIEHVTSVFEWDGAIETATECSLICKSTSARAMELKDKIVSAHPYECPAVVVLPAVGGHAPFLDWIGTSVSDTGAANSNLDSEDAD